MTSQIAPVNYCRPECLESVAGMAEERRKQLLALTVVLRHLTAERNMNGRRISMKDFSVEHLKFGTTEKTPGNKSDLLNLFLQQQEFGERSGKYTPEVFKEFEEKCKIYLKRKIEQSTTVPNYIREALFVAFPDLAPPLPKPPTPSKRPVDAIADLFDQYNLDSSRSKTLALLKALGGKTYDVYRWTGPSSDPETEREPRVIRAAAQFVHPYEKLDGFARFFLNYRPYLIGSQQWQKTPARPAEGVVVPIGEYFLLVGLENRSRYPLIVFAKIDLDQPDTFGGLVVRKADSKPQIFASRVLFRENTDIIEKVRASAADMADRPKENGGTTLENLNHLLGIAYKSNWPTDWPTEVADLLEDIRNTTNHGGASALTLKPYY